jgi:hypothetical protein
LYNKKQQEYRAKQEEIEKKMDSLFLSILIPYFQEKNEAWALLSNYILIL